MKLEPPKCKWGFTQEQVKRLLGSRLEEFENWSMGSTCAICPIHGGPITYECDLIDFLEGRPNLD